MAVVPACGATASATPFGGVRRVFRLGSPRTCALPPANRPDSIVTSCMICPLRAAARKGAARPTRSR
jgi:hypothetical protein